MNRLIRGYLRGVFWPTKARLSGTAGINWHWWSTPFVGASVYWGDWLTVRLEVGPFQLSATLDWIEHADD